VKSDYPRATVWRRSDIIGRNVYKPRHSPDPRGAYWTPQGHVIVFHTPDADYDPFYGDVQDHNDYPVQPLPFRRSPLDPRTGALPQNHFMMNGERMTVQPFVFNVTQQMLNQEHLQPDPDDDFPQHRRMNVLTDPRPRTVGNTTAFINGFLRDFPDGTRQRVIDAAYAGTDGWQPTPADIARRDAFLARADELWALDHGDDDDEDEEPPATAASAAKRSRP
jgi:hypothetical protein